MGTIAAMSPLLGLFGTGHQAYHNCRAICAARPINRVQVFSPNPAHRQAFVQRMAGEPVEVVAVDDPRAVVRGAHVVCCATNSKAPVLDGDWLEDGQMVITIANSDVLNVRREVDEKTFARAGAIIINDWESVTANRQVEENRGRHDRHFRHTRVEADVVLFEPADGSGRRVEAERAAAGKDHGVHLVNHVERIEEIGFARPGRAAAL